MKGLFGIGVVTTLLLLSTSSMAQSRFIQGLGLQAGILNIYQPILPEGALNVSSNVSGEVTYKLRYNLNPAFGVATYPSIGVVTFASSAYKEFFGGHYHFPVVGEFSPLIKDKRVFVIGAGLAVFGFGGGGWKTRTYIAPQLALGVNFPAESQRFSLRLASGLSNIKSRVQSGSITPYRNRYWNTTLACYYRVGK